MRQQNVLYYNDAAWEFAICWKFNDKVHRNGDLPATYYFDNKKLDVVYYRQHGKFHRTTGPAIIDYERRIKNYYYHGKSYASLEEIKMLEVCK